jgi:fructose-1,6-bisphosphatase/inositol monophosphatase family enzyme
LVATGRAEAMFDPSMKLWDAAALRPIIEEAGGVFTDWHGQPTHRGDSVVSTNAALARDLRELLNQTP